MSDEQKFREELQAAEDALPEDFWLRRPQWYHPDDWIGHISDTNNPPGQAGGGK